MRIGNQTLKFGGKIGNDALGRIASEVEHRPLVTLGIAFGVGILIGLLAHGVSAASRPINGRDRVTNQPIASSGDMFSRPERR